MSLSMKYTCGQSLSDDQVHENVQNAKIVTSSPCIWSINSRSFVRFFYENAREKDRQFCFSWRKDISAGANLAYSRP